MVATVIFMNILPSVSLIILNKKIYNVVQQKIKIVTSLNRRKVILWTNEYDYKRCDMFSEERSNCVPSSHINCSPISALSLTQNISKSL